jgi:hypothetical protein
MKSFSATFQLLKMSFTSKCITEFGNCYINPFSFQCDNHCRVGPLFSTGAISSFSQKNASFYDVLLKFSNKKTIQPSRLEREEEKKKEI